MSEKSYTSRNATAAPLRARILRQLPNWLTFLRLALIPLFVILLVEPSTEMIDAAIVVFIIAAITDYVDGLLARRWGAVSDFGKLLDPIADKILVMAALVMLTAQRSDLYGEPWVPGWIVVFVLAREIWITGLRAVAASQGLILAAGNTGKWKSGLQMVAIILLMLHERPFPFPFIGAFFTPRLTCQIIGLNLMLVSIALSYWSAIEYTYRILFAQRQEREITAQIAAFKEQAGQEPNKSVN